MGTKGTTLWPAAIWVLRATVALQCVGNAWWFLRIEETPLLSFLWGSPDLGGLGWSEAAALNLQHAIGWCALQAAVCVLARPCASVLAPVTLLQIAIAAAMVRMHWGSQVEWTWPWAAFLLPPASQLARIAAPLGLMIVDPWLSEQPLAGGRRKLGFAILGAAIAVTFIAHGIKACVAVPQFVDFNIVAASTVLGWTMSESTSRALLFAIGIVDILVALLVVCVRWRFAIMYMAVWGFLTAAVRLVVFGWEHGWHEWATRAPHFGIPLAIALYWSFAKSEEVIHEER